MLLTACHCSAVYLSCTLVPLSLTEKNPLFCGLSGIKLLNHLFPHKHKDKCQILNRLATFGVHSDFETGMHDLLINKIYIPTKLFYFFCRITEFILNPVILISSVSFSMHVQNMNSSLRLLVFTNQLYMHIQKPQNHYNDVKRKKYICQSIRNITNSKIPN